MKVRMGLIPRRPACRRSSGHFAVTNLLLDEANALCGCMNSYHSKANCCGRCKQDERRAVDRFHGSPFVVASP